MRLFKRLCKLSILALATAGCRYGVGGTGERVVPPDRLRSIEPMNLGSWSAYRPPETEPATRQNVAEDVPTATAPAATLPVSSTPATTQPADTRVGTSAPSTSPAGTDSPTAETTTRNASSPKLPKEMPPDLGPGPLSDPPQPIDASTTQPAPGPARPSPQTDGNVTAAPPAGGPATVPASPSQPSAPVEVYLSLADVRRLTLQNNLDLRVELLNPSIARQSLTEAEAAFEATFTTNINYAKTDAAVASQLVGSQSEVWQVSPGLDIPLRTGGLIRLGVPLVRSETDNTFTFLNPAYSTGPTATLSLPLLRGFGIDANAQRIRVAFYQLQATEARTKLEVIRVLADAERVYWRLYAAREELKLRRAEHALAQAQLEAARRQLRQQVVPEVDVLRAESGAADRFESIILAEQALRDRQRELKRILNAPSFPLGGTEEIIPATRPTAVAYTLDGQRLTRAALATRMELLETELQILSDDANVRAARNDLLPLLSLEYTYGVNGLGGSLDDSLSQVRSAKFQDHQAGLRLEVPIGNEAARSRYRQSLYSRLQRLATKEQRQLQIEQEVLAAVDGLEASWQRILSARKRVLLAVRVVEGEQRQYDLGRRTSTEVLDAQTRLADARQSEIAAVAEYQISQVDIAFATGMLLGQSRVAYQPTVRPEVEHYR